MLPVGLDAERISFLFFCATYFSPSMVCATDLNFCTKFSVTKIRFGAKENLGVRFVGETLTHSHYPWTSGLKKFC